MAKITSILLNFAIDVGNQKNLITFAEHLIGVLF